MTLTYIGKEKKHNLVLWKNTMNEKRPFQLYKGRVHGGKLLGSYGSIDGVLKKHPELKRK